MSNSWAKLIGGHKLGELRAAAHPEGKKGLWMSKWLDDEQFAEIYVRIFENNEDMRDIARMVRDEWGIQRHWDLKDFVKGLVKWKHRLDSTMSKAMEAQVDEDGQKQVAKARKKLQECYAKVDALGRLGFAIELQTKRLLMAHEREDKVNYPMELTDKIQANLTDMCKNYVKLAIKTGAIDGVASEVNVNLNAESELVLKHVIGGDGNKMVKAARTFLRTAVAKCIPMELDEETGEYVPVIPEKEVAPIIKQKRSS